MNRKRVVIHTEPAFGMMQGHVQSVVFVDDPAGAVMLASEVLREIELLVNERDGYKGLLAHEREGKAVLRQEYMAAEARVKELEGMEVKLIETSGQCFQVARRYQLESGEHPTSLATWLEGRLKRLAELKGGLKDQREMIQKAAEDSPIEWARRHAPVRPVSPVATRPSNLEEITAQLLTVGDGVDARLEALEEDLGGARGRLCELEGCAGSSALVLSGHDERLSFLEKDGAEDHQERGFLTNRVKTLERAKADFSILVTNLLNRLAALESQAKHQS